LRDEIKSRIRANRIPAQRFGERIQDVLRRYELQQLTSAEVVQRLVEIAKELRDARHRHEQLGLSEEEAAFYDALAGGVEHVTADPELAAIAHELVASIRIDLTVDWADREATQAKVRTKIKRLLRRHRKELAKTAGAGGSGPHDLNYYTDLILEQARDMYRYWPEVGDRLFS
jgi:type I restriction enzyme, R subunit